MLENGKLNGIHYSRYVASWRNVGGYLDYPDDEPGFSEWLKTFGATDEQVRDICEMAMCGKMELEMDARKYMQLNKLK